MRSIAAVRTPACTRGGALKGLVEGTGCKFKSLLYTS